MKYHKEKLKLQFKDYQRFAITLLILAFYLYMGAIINTYIHYSQDGSGLTILSFAAVTVAGWFSFQTHRIKIKLQE